MGKITDERDIECGDGRTMHVITTQHDVMSGLRLSTRVLKALAAGTGGEAPSALTPAIVLKALTAIDPDDLLALARELLVRTVVVFDGSEKHELSTDAKINKAFDGDLAALFKVLGAALEVNFKRFFPGGPSGVVVTPRAT